MPYAPTPSGARYHYELYGDGDEKVIFVAGFACCKGYWKATVANLLNRGRAHAAGGVAPASPLTGSPSTSSPSSLSHSLSSPISISAERSSHTRLNRYQICVFDTRGFGKSTIGGLTRFSTSSMAIDVLAILCHLGWVSPSSPESPYCSLAPPASFPPAAAPVLHIVSWSLGGMICQELSFVLLAPSSQLSHALTSLVFTSSSPGGYREPDEPPLAYVLRNQPPWSGMKHILRCLVLSFTAAQRIHWLLRLHYGEAYLNKEWTGDWPLEDEEECFCVHDCEKAAVRAMRQQCQREEKQEELREKSQGLGLPDRSDSDDESASRFPSPLPTPADGSRLTNRDVLARIYARRSPFDRNVLLYLYSLFHHVVAVYTHAFTRERFHLLHQYNTITQSSPADPSLPKTYTRTTTSITIPSTLPAPPALTVPSRRVHPLVLVGDQDELITPQNSLTLARSLHCPCLIFTNSGHMAYVEHAHLYSALLHKHFTFSRSSNPPPSYYEDSTLKVVDYTHPAHSQRRLSTISPMLSSGASKGGRRLAGLKRLLTFFFVWKVVSRLPQFKGWNARFVSSFSEVVRPLVLLHRHLRALLCYHMRSLLAFLALI